MDARRTTYLAVGAAAVAVASPLLILFSPFLLVVWFALALVQLFAPARLPPWLNESTFMMHSGAALTSAVRVVGSAVRKSFKEPSKAAAIPAPAPPPVPPALLDGAARSLDDIASLDAEGRYEELQSALRALIAKDAAAAFGHPAVKAWLGKRWRNLLLQYAAEDPVAVAAASRSEFFGFREDSRPVPQRLAEQFLKQGLTASAERPSRVDEWELVPGVRGATAPGAVPAVRPLPAAGPLPDLSGAATFVFIPGIITGMLPVREFDPEMAKVQAACGVPLVRVTPHPLRGSAGNVADLLAGFERGEGERADLSPTGAAAEPPPPPPERVVVLAYSKGMSDLLEFLVAHPEWQERVVCIFSWAGVIGGSPLGDQALAGVSKWPIEKMVQRLDEILEYICPVINLRKGPLKRMEEMDVKGAIRDTTVEARQAWLRANRAALEAMRVPVLCVTASCLVHETAYFNASGWMLLNLYDGNNDMQVTQEAAKLDTPLSTHLACLHANHWDISFGSFPVSMTLGSRKLVHPFPKQAALTAMLALVHELGLNDKA